jgi:phosphate transport system substrate-binding protein
MDLLPFTENFGYYPTEITVATGAFDPGKKGGSGSLVIFVNKDNPITKLTMKQLDGIFGAERTGGLKGIVLSPEFARSAKEDIRTWGQLGLTGDWADRQIQTYGYTFTGMKWFFQMKVLHGGQKWNPNYREYVETESFMVDRENPLGRTLTIDQMLADLSKDKYGVAYCPLHYAKNFPQLKPLAIASQEGGPYIEPSRESYQNRSYPLTRSVFIYLNRVPRHPVDPKLKEFLTYILSREGQQELVKYGRYLPLPAEVVREQLKKLE